MNANSNFHFQVAMVLFFASVVALSSAAAQPPSQPGGCSDELIAFSRCLPYISSAPNNLSDSPSIQCCDLFVSASATGDVYCLCYLIRQPLILGFPINVTRLTFLTSFCPMENNNGSNEESTSLDSLCSGSPSLPPLHSPKDPAFPNHNVSDNNDKSPPAMSSAEDSGSNSLAPTRPNSPLTPTSSRSSTTTMYVRNRCSWFQTIRIFPLLIFIVI